MLSSLLLSLMLSTAVAQEVQIKAEPHSDESTIEVRKKNYISSDLDYKVEEGTDNIDGDAAPLLQDARKNWKTACDQWKKEFRENNAGNKVITVNCGSMKCTTETMETTCRSEAKYKVRVKLKD